MNVAVEYSNRKLETDVKSEAEKEIQIFNGKIKIRTSRQNIFII